MINSKNITRPKLVLIVDDQELNRDILGMILEEDYEIIYAENGKEALELMNERYDDLSIVLLDLIMPVMNGFEVLEVVKNDERLSHIPIIVLTAEKDAELQALQLGAADFITKPFDVHEVILARVGRIIELSEGRKLISAAEHDRLTMLYSKNFFYEYCKRIYQYHPEKKMDAVVMNIDQFHSINDVNGRDFGDDILRIIGNEVRALLGETEGIASRIEGDKFHIYCSPQPDYRALLDRFQTKVDTINPKVSVHIRMGVTPYKEGVDPVRQFDRARAAANMVRGNYQQPLMIYDENMRLKELLNQRLLNELSIAAQEGQLQVYYQPKYDIQCEPPKLSSAEALIRWNHPDLGLIPPGDFIPLFEGNGMISVVDQYVWQEAASQVARWKDKYDIHLPVSVNMSRTDIFDPGIVDRLVHLVKFNELDFKDLKLEITESAYTNKGKELLKTAEKLRSCGFEIEMDDFGSGYSSLNMLSELPIDILKMDMKFVRNIEYSKTDMRLVKLILDIAKYLELKVVAEGVETKGQLELLKAAGCDLVQGYYFSKPVPADEFEKLIEKELSTERN